MSPFNETEQAILKLLHQVATQNQMALSSTQIGERLGITRSTLQRHLTKLCKTGALTCSGNARARRYRLTGDLIQAAKTVERLPDQENLEPALYPQSPSSLMTLRSLKRPLAMRTPVSYQKDFVLSYIPNETHLLPKDLAMSLYKDGKMSDQQPAGTYARKVLEQLLIDLSWSSSRLEGNQRTLLETAELFRRGADDGDKDALMLLNHKRSIEFIVDAVPEYGLSMPVIRNIQALLMQDLLEDVHSLGEIRKKIVHISDTVYVPTQVPEVLDEMLRAMIDTAQRIKNPVEAAFFLWINIAYLQPFEDGNKRTSRLAANIPLMMYNCAPLSFIDCTIPDYAYAMMGVYEMLDPSPAADLFAWTYRRSIDKYRVILDAMGHVDPLRVKYRDTITKAIQIIVNTHQSRDAAIKSLKLPVEHLTLFINMLDQELRSLTIYNCARHQLSIRSTEEWIVRGRPN